MQKIELTLKELTRIVFSRKMSQVDKKVAPYALTLLAIATLGVLIAGITYSANNTPESYILETGQVLQIDNNEISLDGNILIVEDNAMPAGIAALIVSFFTIAILSFLVLAGLVIYEFHTCYKAKDAFLETIYIDSEKGK